MPTSQRALLVERFPSHGFLVAPLARSLEAAGYAVSLAIHPALADDVAGLEVTGSVRLLEGRLASASLPASWRLARLIRREAYDLVFFLTVRTKGVVTLASLLPRTMRLAGVHHNPDKIWRGRSQRRLVRRGFRFLVLSRRSCRHVQAHVPGVRVDYLYPGRLDPCDYIVPAAPPPLRLAVPGELSLAKRDYRRLIDAVIASPQAVAGMRFELLGNGASADGATIRGWIREGGVDAFFRIWPERIPADEYERRLRQCHAILPLIHGHQASSRRFRTVKTSGAMILAHQYGLPLILESGFRQADQEYDSQALFYNGHELSACLETLPARLPVLTQTLHQALEAEPRFNGKLQQERFAAFLAP